MSGPAEIIADEVSIPLDELADAAGGSSIADQDRPPAIVGRDLLRSTGNVLSGLLTPLADYARDAGSAIRKGSLDDTGEFARRAALGSWHLGNGPRRCPGVRSSR